MNEHDRTPKYKPSTAPVKPPQSREMTLKRYIAGVWIGPTGEPRVVCMSQLRKTAENYMRYQHMNDGSSYEMNHHTRYYIWDTTVPWNPDSLYCWTPVAERPCDQWVPTR